jgi:YD repeat-containing protein
VTGTIQVSPDGLREAGERLYNLRVDMVSNTALPKLHGYGEDQHISTGGFRMGANCQEHLGGLVNQANQAFIRVHQDLTGLCSALYIVADLYHSTDHEEAMKFAFDLPGATVPANLPSHIDPNRTSRELREQMQAEAALAGGGPLPPGWTEKVTTVNIATGTLTITTIYDQDGNKIVSRSRHVFGDGTESTTTRRYDADGNETGHMVYRTQPDGSNESISYDENGNVTSRTVHTVTAGGGYRTDTYVMMTDANGRQKEVLQQSQSRDVTSSGSQYTTERYEYDQYGNQQGDPTQVDEFQVNPQPEAVQPGDLPFNDDPRLDYQMARAEERTELPLGVAGYAEVGDYGEVPVGDVSWAHFSWLFTNSEEFNNFDDVRNNGAG